MTGNINKKEMLTIFPELILWEIRGKTMFLNLIKWLRKYYYWLHYKIMFFMPVGDLSCLDDKGVGGREYFTMLSTT